jgi:hypothetical protein
MRTMIAAIVAGVLMSTVASAQTTSTSTSNSGSTARSTSSSQSGTSHVRTSSTQTINNIVSQPAAGSGTSDPPSDPSTTTPGLGTAGNPLTENIGGTQTIRNTPEIIAPNISGGNPCLVGISGGGAGPGIGVTIGIGYSDHSCERRNEAALLSNIGQRDVAIELMCDDSNVRAAMLRTGHPCAGDRVVAAPVAAIDPDVVRRQQAAAMAPVAAPMVQLVNAPPAKPARPEWCYTASKQELRGHPQCD